MITIFKSLFAKAGEFRPACTPAALVAWLSKPKAYDKKDRATRWGAFRSVDGRRRAEDLREHFALVFDVDEPVSIDVICEVLADVHAFVVSTWSATEAAPRWRVVVFLSRSITPSEFPRVWRAGAELVERVAQVDLAAKNGSHIWSAPSMQPGGFFACRETEGALLDVDTALERFPEEQPLPIRAITVANCGDAFRRAERYVARIPGAVSGNRGHAQTFAVARALAGFVRIGLSEAEAWNLLLAFNERCEPPWTEKDLAHKWKQATTRATRIPDFEPRRVG